MRTRVASPIIVIVSLFASKLLANEPTQSGLPAECSSPEALAFGKGIKDVLSKSEQLGQGQQAPSQQPAQHLPQQLWSKDATFRRWAARPKSTMAEVDRYLRCTPTASATEVQLATLTLQCLDFGAYLKHLKGLSLSDKNDAVGWGLYYAIAPGFLQWSTRLAAKHTDARVKSTLKEVERSANANTTVRKMIIEILDGSAQKVLDKRPVKPILTCVTREGD